MAASSFLANLGNLLIQAQLNRLEREQKQNTDWDGPLPNESAPTGQITQTGKPAAQGQSTTPRRGKQNGGVK